MWQHKQEERELKRTEGDIIKNQRAVRHTLRDFENGTVFHVILVYCMLDYFWLFVISIQSRFKTFKRFTLLYILYTSDICTELYKLKKNFSMRRDLVQNCTSIYMLNKGNNNWYFTAINKKRMAEEKKLSQGLEKYTVLRRDHIHKKEEVRLTIKIWEFALFLLTDKKYSLKIFCYQS